MSTRLPSAAQVANHIARQYALQGGAIALAQIVVAQTTALAHADALVVFVHNLPAPFGNPALANGALPADTVLMVAGFTLVSGLLGGILTLVAIIGAAYSAGRFTGATGAGMRAGMLVATYSGLLWLGLGAASTLFTNTDGFVLVADPYNTTPPIVQALLIALTGVLRGALVWGISLLVAVIGAALGAEAGANRARPR